MIVDYVLILESTLAFLAVIIARTFGKAIVNINKTKNRCWLETLIDNQHNHKDDFVIYPPLFTASSRDHNELSGTLLRILSATFQLLSRPQLYMAAVRFDLDAHISSAVYTASESFSSRRTQILVDTATPVWIWFRNVLDWLSSLWLQGPSPRYPQWQEVVIHQQISVPVPRLVSVSFIFARFYSLFFHSFFQLVSQSVFSRHSARDTSSVLPLV